MKRLNANKKHAMLLYANELFHNIKPRRDADADHVLREATRLVTELRQGWAANDIMEMPREQLILAVAMSQFALLELIDRAVGWKDETGEHRGWAAEQPASECPACLTKRFLESL